jgi:hypothetical protein
MDENQIGARGGNIAFSRAALRGAQITGHYNEFQTQNNVQFAVDGVFGTLAPADNQAFSSGHTTITGCNTCFFGIWVNNTNVIATTQGPLVDPAELTSGLAKLAVPFPDVVSNNVLIGLLKIKVGGGGSGNQTFTPGTTNLNATNITATFYDTTVMPSKPLQS